MQKNQPEGDKMKTKPTIPTTSQLVAHRYWLDAIAWAMRQQVAPDYDEIFAEAKRRGRSVGITDEELLRAEGETIREVVAAYLG